MQFVSEMKKTYKVIYKLYKVIKLFYTEAYLEPSRVCYMRCMLLMGFESLEEQKI